MENDIKLNYFQWTTNKLRKDIVYYKRELQLQRSNPKDKAL